MIFFLWFVLLFTEEKSNTLPISKSVLIASLQKCKQLKYNSTLVRIRMQMPFCMRKHSSVCIRNLQLLSSSWMGHRKSSAALLIVCERIFLLLGADHSSADQRWWVTEKGIRIPAIWLAKKCGNIFNDQL